MSEGFDFLGFRIQWKRKRGTNKWYVYTFIADRPFRSVKAKIRALTHRTSQQDLRDRADPAQPDHARLDQLLQARRRATHLQQAASTSSGGGSSGGCGPGTAGSGRTSVAGSPTPTGRWQPISADGIELFNPETVPVTRYRYRGNTDPQPLDRCPNHARRQKPWRARCGESRTPGSASGLGKRTGSNAGTAPQADSTGTARP